MSLSCLCGGSSTKVGAEEAQPTPSPQLVVDLQPSPLLHTFVSSPSNKGSRPLSAPISPSARKAAEMGNTFLHPLQQAQPAASSIPFEERHVSRSPSLNSRRAASGNNSPKDSVAASQLHRESASMMHVYQEQVETLHGKLTASDTGDGVELERNTRILFALNFAENKIRARIMNLLRKIRTIEKSVDDVHQVLLKDSSNVQTKENKDEPRLESNTLTNIKKFLSDMIHHLETLKVEIKKISPIFDSAFHISKIGYRKNQSD